MFRASLTHASRGGTNRLVEFCKQEKKVGRRVLEESRLGASKGLPANAYFSARTDHAYVGRSSGW